MMTALLNKRVLTALELQSLREWLAVLDADCADLGPRPDDAARIARIRTKIEQQHDIQAIAERDPDGVVGDAG